MSYLVTISGFAVALAGAAAGCQAIATFDTSSISEDTDALCADEIDNDGNGLSDCHDFGCLGAPVCCTIPTVEIEDGFDCPGESASCDEPCAPDPDRWQAWGEPAPIVCEGGLVPNKREQCYDVGVLSRASVILQPGLSVSATLSGVPEQRGRLELGLTLQEQVAGGDDPCAPIDTVRPVISVRLLAADGGSRLVARFDGVQIGLSSLLEGESARRVTIEVGDDRRVRYAVDGEEIAASPPGRPIPSGLEARLSLSGRGLSARFEGVSVTVGTQCEDPSAWGPAEEIGELAPGVAAWDAFAVQAPALAGGPGGLEVYYAGCGEALGECDPLIAGLGHAVFAPEGPGFARDEELCPLVGAPAFVCEGGMENPFADRFNNLIDAAPVEHAGERLLFLSQIQGGKEIRAVRRAEEPPGLAGEIGSGLRSGAAGDWDAFEICCPAALSRGGELLLWYAGRAGPMEPWRIGLAVSSDGLTFEKSPENPVLGVGEPGSFDEGGAGAPAVVFDRGLYRMWYQAAGFFGASSIGYAVSTDGRSWHKLPSAPILEPADLDLAAIGAPSVLVDGARLLMMIEGEGGQQRRIYTLENLGSLPE